MTTFDVEEEKNEAEQYDAWMGPRIEYMYDYFDYDSDRTKIRKQFLTEMHKKTSIKDIGEKLDEFILDSKADILMQGYW